MQKVKKVLGKIIAFSILSAALDVLFHAVLAPTYSYDYPASYIITSGLFKPVAGISLLIIFILLGVVFVYIQENLPGKKTVKGLRFGISFGGLWLLGVIGMTVFFASPLMHEFLGGSCDCAAIVILSVLLGRFTATDSPDSSDGTPIKVISAILIIAFFFIIGQYLALILMKGTPHLNLSGSATFVWTVVLGLWAGVVYWLLQQSVIKVKSIVKRSLIFGGVIIGIDWVLFNLFVLLFVAVPVLDPVILSVLNTVSIIIGMFVYEMFFLKKDTE